MRRRGKGAGARAGRLLAAGIGAAILACAAPPGAAAGLREARVVPIQSWDQLTPEQQNRAMQNFQRYQRMPEGSRERIQRGYQQFQGLPPGEQEKVRRNFDIYRNMTPDQRQDFSQRYQRWKGGH